MINYLACGKYKVERIKEDQNVEDIERLASLEVGTQESHGKENRFRGWLGGARSIKSFFPENVIKFLCQHHITSSQSDEFEGKIGEISLNLEILV